MNRTLVFGVDVPCRDCAGLGRRRGSGLDPRELARRHRIREKNPNDPAGEVPTTYPCETCDGTGVADEVIADRDRGGSDEGTAAAA